MLSVNKYKEIRQRLRGYYQLFDLCDTHIVEIIDAISEVKVFKDNVSTGPNPTDFIEFQITQKVLPTRKQAQLYYAKNMMDDNDLKSMIMLDKIDSNLSDKHEYITIKKEKVDKE